MTTMDYYDILPTVSRQLASGGLFLTAGADAPNTMTIGWAFTGYSWRKPIFVAMVRPSRHTYGLLKARGEFTVSVPLPEDGMADALRICGTLSGRDVNKWEKANITPLKGRAVSTPVVGQCALHVELKTVNQSVLEVGAMEHAMRAASYPTDDIHALFFGEVVDCYGR